MKYLNQFLIIMSISFLGELLNQVIPLPVPASIYGLILMLIALSTKIIPLEKVETVGNFMLDIMPIMFIPGGVGLLTAWDSMQKMIIPFTVITILTTVIVMVVSGHATQTIIRIKKRKEKE